MIKNQQFHKEREQPPRFAQPGSLDYEYTRSWRTLTEMEKQQDQADHNIREAGEKLEVEMEATHHEHQVMLMRQDLTRQREQLWRMEMLLNQEVQKGKQLELRQDLERRCMRKSCGNGKKDSREHALRQENRRHGGPDG